LEKLFMTAEDIADDLNIGIQEAKWILTGLQKKVKQKGSLYVAGLIQAAYYQQMKNADFLLDDGTSQDKLPLAEKRLLNVKEFCTYSGLGRDAAYKFGKRVGIIKHNGKKILFDRVLFDEWCNENREAKL